MGACQTIYESCLDYFTKEPQYLNQIPPLQNPNKQQFCPNQQKKIVQDQESNHNIAENQNKGKEVLRNKYLNEEFAANQILPNNNKPLYQLPPELKSKVQMELDMYVLPSQLTQKIGVFAGQELQSGILDDEEDSSKYFSQIIGSYISQGGRVGLPPIQLKVPQLKKRPQLWGLGKTIRQYNCDIIMGTCFQINSRYAITCRHNLFPSKKMKSFKELKVFLIDHNKLRRDSLVQYKQFQVEDVRYFQIDRKQYEKKNFDYALLKLKTPNVLPSYLQLGIWPEEAIENGNQIGIYGYPLLNQFDVNKPIAGQTKIISSIIQRTVKQTITLNKDKKLLEHLVSTKKGQSGSPVIIKQTVLGIHAAAHNNNKFNVAIPITFELINQIIKWMVDMQKTQNQYQFQAFFSYDIKKSLQVIDFDLNQETVIKMTERQANKKFNQLKNLIIESQNQNQSQRKYKIELIDILLEFNGLSKSVMKDSRITQESSGFQSNISIELKMSSIHNQIDKVRRSYTQPQMIFDGISTLKVKSTMGNNKKTENTQKIQQAENEKDYQKKKEKKKKDKDFDKIYQIKEQDINQGNLRKINPQKNEKYQSPKYEKKVDKFDEQKMTIKIESFILNQLSKSPKKRQ